jgi:hypothetical protein
VVLNCHWYKQVNCGFLGGLFYWKDVPDMPRH